MAVFIPTIEQIKQFKVKPEVGELALLSFLEKNLDDSYEVYFNPYMNGDRPDIIIMRRRYGVMIIEVKDWNLDNYYLDERKHWILKQDDTVIKSPISQVLKYKDNLFELHIESLLEQKIKDFRKFNMVACAVYFHNANIDQINDLLVKPYEKDKRYQDFLYWNIDLIGRNTLTESDFKKLLENRRIISDSESILFTDELYWSFKRFLNPTVHMKNEGKHITYSSKQKEIIFESQKKQQRIKGVVGSGKTTVLAARAVYAYKRAVQNNPQARVLILTYNITLKNFIHDKLNLVEEEFPWSAFTILNYHSFINAELNNMGIVFSVPENLSGNKLSDFLDRNYYSNKAIFVQHQERIKPFDVILIDEIQDYKRAWMDIIKDCFLTEDGEYLLFGDVKQNIYNNETEHKDVKTNIPVRPIELKESFRSDFKIRDLAIEYQKNIFKDKYEIDSFNERTNEQMQIGFDKQGYISYAYLQDTNIVSTLYTIIHENIINKNNNIAPNDITILGYTTRLLQTFEAYYRHRTNERTTTMFETFEIMYLQNLNRLNSEKYSQPPIWLKELLKLIKKDGNKYVTKRGLNQIARLFTIYDLYSIYPKFFEQKLSFVCDGTTKEAFLAFVDKYKDELTKFKNQVYSSDYKVIRENKKLHFWMNSGTIKISTIHSFKGWESEVVFLIVEKREDYSVSFDELLYTGLTRCKSNLVIINFGNEEYHEKIKPLIEKVK